MLRAKSFHCDLEFHRRVPVCGHKLVMFKLDHIAVLLRDNACHTIITVEDEELVVSFLDMVENHKMVIENSGLLTVAAIKHLDCRDGSLPCRHRRIIEGMHKRIN